MDSGRVIGLWQFRDTETNTLEYHIFERYNDRKKIALQKLEDWARAITKLTGVFSANLIERGLPEPLAKRPQGAFLWPLGKIHSSFSARKSEESSPMERRTSNTFRQRYLDNDYLVRPNEVVMENVTNEELVSEQAAEGSDFR